MDEIEYLLIKNKIAYYYPELVQEQPTHDDQYDNFEVRYLQLCMLLDEPNEFVHKKYSKIPNPENPEEEIEVHKDWNGTGMMELDFKHSFVKKVLKSMTPAKGKKKKGRRKC